MTGLIILLLLAAAAVYAVFFLIFKLIWMIIKKQSNKWPLILAGVCTVLFCAAAVGGTVWGVYKVTKPFKGIVQSIRQNPMPIYGETVYTDPEYGFELTVFNGMEFSDWMHFSGADVKLGIDTNIFKKDNAGKNMEGPVTLAALARVKNDSDKTSLQSLEKALANNKDRRIEVNELRRTSLNGHPALYFAGTAYSNHGDKIPVWMTAAEDGKYVYYAAVMQVSEQPTSQPQQMVQSLRFNKED